MVFCSFLTFLTLLFFRWRKRFRKVKWLCQGHWSSEWQSWGLQLQMQSCSRVCPKSLQSKLKLHSVTYNQRILKEVEVLERSTHISLAAKYEFSSTMELCAKSAESARWSEQLPWHPVMLFCGRTEFCLRSRWPFTLLSLRALVL